MLRTLLVLIINLILFSSVLAAAKAQTAKMGMHVLNKEDALEAVTLLRTQDPTGESWVYMTIPFTLDDVHKTLEWQTFFDQAKAQKIVPIIRLVTDAQEGIWQIPTRKDVIDQLTALGSLEWPIPERRVLIYNEVNHAQEWGGKLDPAGYARMFRFASLWADAMGKNFIIMPAAMDLAAANGHTTREAFAYLDAMAAEDTEIFSYADAWNSHSYPNPAFSAPPTSQGKNSLRGYEYELAYLAQKGISELPVYITETGWEENTKTARYLTKYYQYALNNIWLPDARIVAVTPFIFKGDPGPFARFSFISADGKPTLQHAALAKVLGASTIRQ